MKLYNGCYHPRQIDQCQEGDRHHWQDFVDDQDWNFVKILLVRHYKRVNYFPQKSVEKSQSWYDSSNFNWPAPQWKELLFVLKLSGAIKSIKVGGMAHVRKHRSFQYAGLSRVLILQREENQHRKQTMGFLFNALLIVLMVLISKKQHSEPCSWLLVSWRYHSLCSTDWIWI